MEVPWLVPLTPPPSATARLPASMRPAPKSLRPSASLPPPRAAESRAPSRPPTSAPPHLLAHAPPPFGAPLPPRGLSADPARLGRGWKAPPPWHGAAHHSEREAALPLPRHGAAHHSDREAALLVGRELSRALEQIGDGPFHQILRAHHEALRALAAQVAAQCEERGALMERLRAFYTRHTQTVVRQATNTARAELGEQLDALEARNRQLEAELAEVKASAFLPSMRADERIALLVKEFGAMNEEMQRDCYEVLQAKRQLRKQKATEGNPTHKMGWGAVLDAVRRDAPGANAATNEQQQMPSAEQAHMIDLMLRKHPADQRAEILVMCATAAGQGGARHQQARARVLRAMIAALPSDVRARFLHDTVMDPQYQREIWPAIFDGAKTDGEKAALLLELLCTMPTKQASNVVAKMLTARENSLTEVSIVMHGYFEMHSKQENVTLVSRLMSFLDIHSATEVIKQWRHLQKSYREFAPTAGQLHELRIELLEMLSEADAVTFLCDLLDRRSLLKPLLLRLIESNHLHDALPALLADASDGARESFLGVAVGAFASSSRGRYGAFDGSPEMVAAQFDEVGAQGVAALYRSLQQPDIRVACLLELTNKDVFGNEELEHLLQYMSAVCPLSLKRYVTVMQAPVLTVPIGSSQESEGFTSAQGATRFSERVFRRPYTKKNTKFSGVSFVEDTPDVLPPNAMLQVVADIMTKKIKDDYEADTRGRDRTRITKCAKEYFISKYEVTHISERHRVNMVASLGHYCGDDEDEPFNVRMQILGQMLGVLENSWSESKTDFYLGFVARVLSAHVQMDKKARALGFEKSRRFDSIVQYHKSFAQGPEKLTSILKSEDVMVRLGAINLILEVMVTNDSDQTRDKLQAVMNDAAIEMTLEGSREAPTTFMALNLDDVMSVVMNAWQEATDERLDEHTQKLALAYDKFDINSNGMLDFCEFKQLMQEIASALSEEEHMDLFEKCLQASSAELGEETDSINREGMYQVLQQHSKKLDPHYQITQTTFVDPVEVAASIRAQQTIKFVAQAAVVKQRTNALRKRGNLTAIISAANDDDESDKPKESKRVSKPKSTGPKDPKTRAIIRGALKNSFLFRHLDDSKLDAVISSMVPNPVKRGEVVIKQGDKGEYFYVCQSGNYDVNVDGRVVHTYEVDGKSLERPSFGELALMYAKPRAAGVVAKTDGMLWKMDRLSFRRLHASAGHEIDLTKILRKMEVFRSLTVAQLQQLRDVMQELSFEDGQLVFKQGDCSPNSAFYIITKGEAIVFTQDTPDAPAKEIMSLGNLQYFGERALLYNEPRSASVKAAGPLQTASVSREEFERILGPLSALIQEDTLKREAAHFAQVKQLEAMGLAKASRDMFNIESTANMLPCGALYLVRHLTTDKLYSMRQEGKQAISEAQETVRVSRELGILRSLNDAQARLPCSSLPSLLHAFQTDGSVCLLFQERACCDLFELISEEPLPENELRFAAACVAQALHVLHDDLQVLHRNLTPMNLTVTDSGYVVLMDHRLTKPDDGSRRTLCGPPSYVGPEMVCGQVQTSAVDWWGFGNLLYELATQESPWGAHEDEMVVFKIISTHQVGNVVLPEMISTKLSELISALLHPSVRERPTASGVQGHPFFADFIWARLMSGEMASPLQELAERVQATRAEDKDFPSEEHFQGTADEHWLAGFEYFS
ncbi:hypothetical protein AB1Y20_002417 [Prymnesium parvum]|uniref:cGMP-dependent protein kinase n=1 Tax=Prymnesium parvum TaxID=97485 RepID=A0AB34J9A4_PRYPA